MKINLSRIRVGGTIKKTKNQLSWDQENKENMGSCTTRKEVSGHECSII